MMISLLSLLKIGTNVSCQNLYIFSCLYLLPPSNHHWNSRFFFGDSRGLFLFTVFFGIALFWSWKRIDSFFRAHDILIFYSLEKDSISMALVYLFFFHFHCGRLLSRFGFLLFSLLSSVPSPPLDLWSNFVLVRAGLWRTHVNLCILLRFVTEASKKKMPLSWICHKVIIVYQICFSLTAPCIVPRLLRLDHLWSRRSRAHKLGFPQLIVSFGREIHVKFARLIQDV